MSTAKVVPGAAPAMARAGVGGYPQQPAQMSKEGGQFVPDEHMPECH